MISITASARSRSSSARDMSAISASTDSTPPSYSRWQSYASLSSTSRWVMETDYVASCCSRQEEHSGRVVARQRVQAIGAARDRPRRTAIGVSRCMDRSSQPVAAACAPMQERQSLRSRAARRLDLVRRGRLLSVGGDARTSHETGCAPSEAGAAAERATETRSRPLVTTVRWSRGTACESPPRVREVRPPTGEDVARVPMSPGSSGSWRPWDVGARVAVVRDERAP
jgi:hypothetical protein